MMTTQMNLRKSESTQFNEDCAWLTVYTVNWRKICVKLYPLISYGQENSLYSYTALISHLSYTVEIYPVHSDWNSFGHGFHPQFCKGNLDSYEQPKILQKARSDERDTQVRSINNLHECIFCFVTEHTT